MMQTHESPRRIRVLLAEDNFFTRFGTGAFLREQEDIDLVGAAPDGERALQLWQQLLPDVLVADLRMPGLDGVQLTATLCKDHPEAAVLVLTNYAGDEDIFQALKAGARGYLTKESSGEQLLAGIRTLFAGKRFIPTEIDQQLRQRRGQQPLTRRERQVLAEVAHGASNREVSATLGISEGTVGLFVSSILNKLGASSRTEATAIALRRGLLPPPHFKD
jgi:DNA-binding NarL/FixJ family response regulator